MPAEAIKTLELHYPMIQVLISIITPHESFYNDISHIWFASHNLTQNPRKFSQISSSPFFSSSSISWPPMKISMH